MKAIEQYFQAVLFDCDNFADVFLSFELSTLANFAGRVLMLSDKTNQMFGTERVSVVNPGLHGILQIYFADSNFQELDQTDYTTNMNR